MKQIIICSIIAVLFAGFASCKGKDDPAPTPEKSKACDIISFSAGGQDWNISGTTVTAAFAKGIAVNSLVPVIEVSTGANIEPKSGVAQDFSSDKTVTYTVTAEDGVTKKTYTAKATVTTGD